MAQEKTKSSLPIYTVDAFVINDKPFTGNPAAVVLLEYDNDLTDELKQSIAYEMNISETAFVAKDWSQESKKGNSENEYTLRWFTPKSEVPLCGHATLASASIIFHRMKESRLIDVEHENEKGTKDERCETTIRFSSRFKGILSACMDWNTGRISLDFPKADPMPIDTSSFPALSDIIREVFAGASPQEMESTFYSPDTKKLLIRLRGSVATHNELKDSVLLKLSPNFSRLLSVPDNDLVEGIIVTIKGSTHDINFYSRYFAPWVGIKEDPVTGSAHTVLAPYWSMEYPEKKKLCGMQASRRGGHLFCRVDGDRVHIEGSAKILIEGKLNC